MTGNPATLQPGGANVRQVLQLEGICLDFAARRVLHGVDLKVAEGEVVVLIGASGSGKTSLLRCINLLNSPTSGRIVIDSETIFDRQAGGGR
ncbi:MAG: ATP-binding cassette domain-containing protein, partial [Pseudomonadota bacterium]